MDIRNHPCFNEDVRHTSGRIHLAVAPRCNVQCNFCNRKYDCANESRPGVTASVLKPVQAVEYLSGIVKRIDNLSVVGIAGPGDPFANPEETLETLERVHAAFPDKLLCVSSNGLSLAEYVSRLAALNVSHVTVTVNAVDPEVGAGVYEWVYFDRKSYYGREAATLLLERQTQAIRLLKQSRIIVKINTVVIPRVNEHHVPEIARYVAKLGADIQNCIPLIPVAGTPFENLEEPSAADMRRVRAQTSMYIPQMAHCARCRADAAGLLGQDAGETLPLGEESGGFDLPFRTKPYIAVATVDGVSVNQHLGRAYYLWIYGIRDGKIYVTEKRPVIEEQRSSDRWNRLAGAIPDCAALLVNAIGQTPLRVLRNGGLYVEAVSGPVGEMVEALFAGRPIPRHYRRLTGHCSEGITCN
ncbi:MAG: nitrogenase cofactor biosynthesis protein NifB [Tannerella sp.]|jgi:nitrogen fixation protein NifB|nr:nitrogenase cofactor biosynthesis protein NifB [Tannerella sp.]